MAESQETRVGNPVIGGEAETPTATHETPPPPSESGAAPSEQQTEVFFSRDDRAQEAGVAPTPEPPRRDDEAERGGSSPAEADRITADQEDSFAEKPHLYALGAFAGAFVVAQILKRLTEDDD
jgi:hypothetical protein